MHIERLLELPEIRHIHFTGIGGISMSGLAEILMDLGYRISGSDLAASEITTKLSRMGMDIHIGHNEENIKDADAIIYTAAVKQDNPELVCAKALRIPIIERAVLLGLLMKKYTYSIAVSGTHGKTTTTSMISSVMLQAGEDPTIHLGGELAIIGGTTRIGGNKYFIVEACEYCESFLRFFPYMAVVLNIEFDHADYFKDISHVKDAFRRFAELAPPEGYVVACTDTPEVESILANLNSNIVDCSISRNDSTWRASDITFDSLGCAFFNILYKGRLTAGIKLSVPGLHNVSNALAASAACLTLGIDVSAVEKGLYNFKGTHRRFEYKGEKNNIKIIDDYAHHPSEIKATLNAAGKLEHKRIWCVFQPHTYTRTKALLDDFTVAFDAADKIIIADIYAAREKDTGEISSSILAERVRAKGKDAVYLESFEDIVRHLENNVSQGDVILTMGAGDIYKVGDMYLNSPCQPSQS